MELIRAERLCLKHADPQDDGDDEYENPSMHLPDNIPDNINIEPLPNMVQINQCTLSK